MVTLLAHGNRTGAHRPVESLCRALPLRRVLAPRLVGGVRGSGDAADRGRRRLVLGADPRGYLPLVGGLLVVAVGWCVVPLWRTAGATGYGAHPRRDGLPLPRVLACSCGCLRSSTSSPGATTCASSSPIRFIPTSRPRGWDLALNAMGRELRPNGAWITGHDTGGLGFTLASPACQRAHGRVGRSVRCLCLASKPPRRSAARRCHPRRVVLAVTATSRVTGIFVPYVMHWWWAISAIAMLSIVWCVVVDIHDARRRDMVALAALLGMIATGTIMLRDLPPVLPGGHLSDAIATVSPPPPLRSTATSATSCVGSTPTRSGRHRMDCTSSWSVVASTCSRTAMSSRRCGTDHGAKPRRPTSTASS